MKDITIHQLLQPEIPNRFCKPFSDVFFWLSKIFAAKCNFTGCIHIEKLGPGVLKHTAYNCGCIVKRLLGNLFLAFGIYWQVASKTIVQPGEGMVLAFSVVLRKSFGTVKVWNDVTLVLLAAVLGFVCLGHVVGVREGTVVSAFLVGFLIKGIAALRTKWGAKSEAKKDGIDSTGAEKTGPQA